MAVRQCVACNELIQEGYSVETDVFDYYCNENCLSRDFIPNHVKELTANGTIEYVDWQPHEMDDEDFFLLMNELSSAHQPHEIAKIIDILNREDAAYYGPEGVFAQFIQYLQHQQKVYDRLEGKQ